MAVAGNRWDLLVVLLEATLAPETELRLVETTSDEAGFRAPLRRAQLDVTMLDLHRPGRNGSVVSRPALFDRLAGAARLTQLSAPAGSGKTVLLRSWIAEAGLADDAGWLSVQRGERDAQRFWLSLLDALRDTAAGSMLVRELTAAPDLDGWLIVERLLEDLGSLERPTWLVIDDLHELRSEEALRQLELLLLLAPDRLRLVLLTRHDLRLGLHRLRLEGELSEIRACDLHFSRDEARALFEAGGLKLSDSALRLLHERTEGWAAGLRLAALSLAGHPDPDRFAAEFSGSDRTVAEYLLAEVLDRQPPEVRRLLLRTSVLERVSGPLADLLTGGVGGERILQELEEANAFVVSLDARQSWFRYHQLFGDLLALELRRTAPTELRTLHGHAADWFAKHGHPIDAVRHAQAAQNSSLAARLLCDHWPTLQLDGQQATADELLTGFPAGVIAADAELTLLTAAHELGQGSLAQAERHVARAIRGSESVATDRRERFEVRLAIMRIEIARRRGDLPTVVEEAQRLMAPAEALDAAPLGRGEELRALALINLGIAQLWSARIGDAERHLERGIALAQRIARPALQITGLAHFAMIASIRSSTLGTERSMQAIELAKQHGWDDEPIVAVAYVVLGLTRVWQGRLDEGEQWLGHAERTLRPELEPVPAMVLDTVRGALELARGRDEDALHALRTAERLTEPSATPFASRTRGFLLQTLVRIGELERVEQALDQLAEPARDAGEVRTALAVLRLAQNDPEAATAALAPVLDGSVPAINARVWTTQAFLLEAIARDALGDAGAAERALEHALDLAEPDGTLLPFLLHPAPQLLKRHARHRTTHASLISDILALLAGRRPAPALAAEQQPLPEPLSESETRVLRYLPTNLSKRDIADELYLSVHTVKTHIHHLYTKLGVHSRGEAVERTRALGLLAPSLGR